MNENTNNISLEMTQLTTIVNNNKYSNKYLKADTIFWGIGIENECYLHCDPITIKGNYIINNIKRERYSIDYTRNYDMNDIKELIMKYYDINRDYKITQMINSHTLDKMDRNGNHKTTYEKIPKLNLKFSGKTILEEWFEYDNEMKHILDPKDKTKTNIFFDGDTIEFITDNFYKINSKDVVNELKENKDNFLNKFNKFKKETKLWEDSGDINYVIKHPCLNMWRSQPKTIVLFNNTTYHIHITLPTEIYNGKIIDTVSFDYNHAKAIRMIQWFEPLFIATLGSPDLFGLLSKNYTKGSMRGALSRYIGIGTYDTNTMIKNKILVKPIDDSRPKNNIIWWRTMVESKLKYKLSATDIGMDFNYSKHYQSGFEFRLLDGFPIESLKSVIDVLLLLCCHALSYNVLSDIKIACENQTWNNLVFETIIHGFNATITKTQINEICEILNIKIKSGSNMLLENFYYLLLEELFRKYHTNKLLEQMTKDFTKINRWTNFNKIQFLDHLNTFI
jgi:hypothetical protein